MQHRYVVCNPRIFNVDAIHVVHVSFQLFNIPRARLGRGGFLLYVQYHSLHFTHSHPYLFRTTQSNSVYSSIWIMHFHLNHLLGSVTALRGARASAGLGGTG